MKYFFTFVLLLSILTSCINPAKEQQPEARFFSSQIDLPLDTTISRIAYLNNHLLLLMNNGRIAVLDSAYKRVSTIEEQLSSVKASWLFSYNDSLFAGNSDQYYYLNSNLEAVKMKRKGVIYGEIFFEDSSYRVYGCCVGEFGGSIFFLDKKTNRTYSYFATCPRQVLRFGNEYVVCNNLAHLGDHMSFLFIKDPRTLYEITDEKLKNHCNWYMTIDSLQDYWLKSKVGDVRVYDSYDAMSLVTFPYKDSLYSVLAEPKATVLAVHRSDTTITVDTLLNRRIAFHEMQVIEAGEKKICLYALTEGSPFAAYQTRGNYTGLIVVKGNRVDFLRTVSSR
jgi:hypothetical protein